MHRVAGSRRHLADLLRRRPLLDATASSPKDPTRLLRTDEGRAAPELSDPEPDRYAAGNLYPRGSSRN